MVDDYLAFGYVPDHGCIVSGVQKLPAAGHYWLLTQGKPRPCRRNIGILDPRRTTGSEAELQEELLRLMRQAVLSRMVADVPLGAFLLGVSTAAAWWR